MELKTVYNTTATLRRLIGQERILDMLNILGAFVEETARGDYANDFSQINMSYRFMLQYLRKGILDTKRQDILDHILATAYSLTDRCTATLAEKEAHSLFYIRRRECRNLSLQSLVDEHRTAIREYNLLVETSSADDLNKAALPCLREREAVETKLFNYVWSEFPSSTTSLGIISTLMSDNAYPIYAKGLLVSALLLGLMTFFDEGKLALLLSSYSKCDNPEVQMRIVIAVLLVTHLYGNRIKLLHNLQPIYASLLDDKRFCADANIAILRLIHSRNTDNLTKKVKDDIMPSIMNFNSTIANKLRGANKVIDIADIEANPEWQQMLENTGLSKKFEEINKIQLEGGDVFIATFAHLKTFPFFNTLSNWFLPFHTDNSLVAGIDGVNGRLGKVIANAQYLCDSDKFSFCLSLASMATSQRDMLLSQFNSNNEGIKEMEAEELHQDERLRDRIANKYVQDLYRFFKLFSRRSEFLPAFNSKLFMLDDQYLSSVIANQATVSLIAEFYFQNGFYEDAIKYFSYLPKISKEVNPLILQKIGFAYQNMEKYQDAIKYYKRYELANDANEWNIKHLAACYRNLHEFDNALKYYYRLAELKPNDANVCLNIGHCLLEEGKVDKALKQYFKAEFIDDASHKSWRPIAWCSFVQGNFQQSKKYYDKIIASDNPTAQDYLNLGHLLLCNNQLEEAIKQYTTARGMFKNFEEFYNAFHADYPVLESKGIKRCDLQVIIDATSQPEL